MQNEKTWDEIVEESEPDEYVEENDVLREGTLLGIVGLWHYGPFDMVCDDQLWFYNKQFWLGFFGASIGQTDPDPMTEEKANLMRSDPYFEDYAKFAVLNEPYIDPPLTKGDPYHCAICKEGGKMYYAMPFMFTNGIGKPICLACADKVCPRAASLASEATDYEAMELHRLDHQSAEVTK